MDMSFTDAEKRFVLAEMIKASTLDIRAVVEFLRVHRVEPDWLSMQLPSGRNVNQCRHAAESMFQASFPPPMLKRKSYGDMQVEHPSKRLAITTNMEPQASPISRNVHIQPRPSPNGYVSSPGVSSPAVISLSATKKRGRPSKADKEAQSRANNTYAPITPAPIAPLPTTVISQDHSSSGPPIYTTSNGDGDTKPKKKGRPPLGSGRPSRDRMTPRSLAPNPAGHVEPYVATPQPTVTPCPAPLEPHIDEPPASEPPKLPSIMPRTETTTGTSSVDALQKEINAT